MNKSNVEKPLEEVRKWKRAISKKIAQMSSHEEIKYFGKIKGKVEKHIVSSKVR